MIIVVDQYGCCLSQTCNYRRSCAQHTTAGDFRTEDGFRPDIKKSVCKSADVEPFSVSGEIGAEVLPSNYNGMDRGFIPLRELDIPVLKYPPME